MITLPTGRQIPLYNIAFDEASQQFFYGSLNVSDYMTRAQKVEVGGFGFDVARANREASDAARDAAGLPRVPDNGETSVLKLWAEGVGNDVASLAQRVRDFAGIGPENEGKRSPLFWAVVIGGLGFLAWQLGVFGWIRKKLSA